MERYAQFTALLLRHQDDLRAFVASVLGDWHAVDDVLQDTAAVLWRKYDSFDPERSFGAWARGVAALEIRKHHARGARVPALLAPEALAALQGAWNAEEDQGAPGARLDALHRCLERVDERGRALLAWRYRDGLELEGVADRCGRGVEAVGKSLQRLRQALGDCVRRQMAAEGQA